jgi:hypothetical protein
VNLFACGALNTLESAMPGEPTHNQASEHADAPESLPALASGLKAIASHQSAATPDEADRRMRHAIQHHFAQQGRRSTSRRRMLGWSGAIAALLGLAITAWLLVPRQPVATTWSLVEVQPADIDRSGRVDILDAWALARQVEANATASSGLDINGDGVVDHRDVDAVAMQAVSISGGSKS